MTRTKKFNKLLKKLHNKEGNIFETNHNLVGGGNFEYSGGKDGKRLYLNKKQIPIRSIRSIDLCFNDGVLIFVDPAYKLTERFKKYGTTNITAI